VSFDVLDSAAAAAEFLGEDYVSPAAIFSSPIWWRAVEYVRPEVSIKYLCVTAAGGQKAVLPAYLYPHGRRNEPYAPDYGFDSREWPANVAGAPWAILGGCSGFFTGLTHSPGWSLPEAMRSVVRPALDYVHAQGFGVVIKYFDDRFRHALAGALDVAASQMPLIDVQAVLRIPPDFASYIPALPAPFRGFVRRDVARFAESGYQLDRPRMTDVLGELPRSWDAVEVHHGARPNVALRESILRGEALALEGAAEVFRVVDATGTPVATALNYRFRNTLACRLVGLDYDRSVKSGAYFVAMYYEPIKWAAAHGIDTLILGIGAIKAKIVRGAELVPLYGFIRDAQGRTLSAEAAEHFAAVTGDRIARPLDNVSRKAFKRPAFMSSSRLGADDSSQQ
jgi:hypothetical protein